MTARWLESDDPRAVKKFTDANQASIAIDHNGLPVFLARNAWHLESAAERAPDVRLTKTREQVQ